MFWVGVVFLVLALVGLVSIAAAQFSSDPLVGGILIVTLGPCVVVAGLVGSALAYWGSC